MSGGAAAAERPTPGPRPLSPPPRSLLPIPTPSPARPAPPARESCRELPGRLRYGRPPAPDGRGGCAKETETTSVPHRPQRSRRAEGPASGVAEWEKAGVGRAGYPEEERSGPWVFNEGRLRGRRIGIVRCSGEMGGQQRRGEGRLEKSGRQPGM